MVGLDSDGLWGSPGTAPGLLFVMGLLKHSVTAGLEESAAATEDVHCVEALLLAGDPHAQAGLLCTQLY